MYKKLLIILTIISFLMFLVINIPTPIRVEGDGVFYYSWLRSLSFDGDFDFKNELEYFSVYDVGSKGILEDELITDIGKTINPYAYGSSVMWAPLFVIASILSFVFSLPVDGYSVLYIFSVNLSTWFFGTASLFVLWGALKKVFTLQASFYSCLALYLATPWIYYQFFEPSMAHMASLLLVSLFLYLIIRFYKNERNNLYFLSLVVFLLVAIRWQNLLFTVAFLPALWQVRGNFRLVINRFLAVATPVVLFWITQMLIWKNLYGHYLLQPQGQGFVRPEFHGVYVLFSSNRGLLLWSPVIILAFLGLYYLYKKSRFLFCVSILAFSFQWLINGSLNDLGGGDAYGARRFIETLPFLALPFAAFYEQIKRKKILVFIFGLLIVLNIFMIDNYRHGNIPRHGEFNVLSVLENIKL